MIAMEHASAPPAPVAHTKQYVFVDEYNRHKRLKVMRACDGCRKRKIRCDGALQNGPWPCGACTRLKLKCVPPSLDQEYDSGSETGDSSPTSGQNQFFFQNPAVTSHPHTTSSPSQSNFSWPAPSTTPATMTSAPTSAPAQQDDLAFYAKQQSFKRPQTRPQMDRSYSDDDFYPPSITQIPMQHLRGDLPSLIRTETAASDSSCGDPEEVDSVAKELSSHMGDLRVDVTSVIPFIADHHKNTPATPAVDDVVLPLSVMNDRAIRIPAEMMPHDERAMDYFGYFFNYIHPYVPVLNKAAFYEQWATDRESISPLLLEAIFACVTRYLDQPPETKKWLALAARHEDSFKDMPRLSNIQALVILLKAREFDPKPGYFYRSWMSLKYISTMAIDLGFHEHCDQHRAAKGACTLGPDECLVRTRIWQTLFALEMFIGGPQGRTDFNVEADTVDTTIPFPAADLDAFEYQTSRRYTVLAQCVKNIRLSLDMMNRNRRTNKDWALERAFADHDPDLVAYLKTLPPDMQIHYPEDGSAPWLGGDHFNAGLHTYYHLCVIMHHRPQLQAKLGKRDPTFKEHLDVCANSAAFMCRIHEALLRDFGLHGLLFMLRGINFAVYCVLTCAMLHLVAITSPDLSLNSQARNYFTRHMRVLEECVQEATPEIQSQINTLREAFSQDPTKPFALKPTLGMRSPGVEKRPTPPFQHHSPTEHATVESWQHLHNPSTSNTVSPVSDYGAHYGPTSVPAQVTSHPTLPFSSASYDLSPSSSIPVTHGFQQTVHTASQSYALEPVMSNEQQAPVWDPSGIFQQWNTAFGPGAQPSQPLQPSPPPGEARIPPLSTASMMAAQPQRMSTTQKAVYGMSPTSQTTLPLDNAAIPGVPAVTPLMWQDAFTNAYISGHGQKRYRDDDDVHASMYNQYQAKRRI